MRRHVGGMPLLTDLSLAMRTDPLALIRGATEFVAAVYGLAVTFAFPDVKVEAYRRSVLHLNLISAVDGSALNWCEQQTVREMMSEDPENLVLSVTRLRDFLVEREVNELSLPVYDPNRGRLHPQELYALTHLIISDTNIQVYLHKK